jgi:hypothetical protein
MDQAVDPGIRSLAHRVKAEARLFFLVETISNFQLDLRMIYFRWILKLSSGRKLMLTAAQSPEPSTPPLS